MSSPLNRLHIAFFGRRNAGKSSVVNCVTGQEVSIVSETKGTTTDPVTKTMELLPLGPVVIIDTPGFDDEGALGEQRVRRTRQILNRTDLAVLVVDVTAGLGDWEAKLLQLFKDKEIPYVIAFNKTDLSEQAFTNTKNEFYVSALRNLGFQELKDGLAKMAPTADGQPLLADLLSPGDTVVFVTPIDEAAPKGRLILPQQQAIRDTLDAGAFAMVCQDSGLAQALGRLSAPPTMVVTDSQAFKAVAAITPPEIPLTSFSILMARHKGFLTAAVQGAAAISSLKAGDKVLIAEGCTHHRQCNDIGTVKLPRLLQKVTDKELQFEFSSGQSFPEDLSSFSLIIHCGACMLTNREVLYRMKCAQDAGIPFTNYGIALAQLNGILKRSITLFPNLVQLLP